MMLNEPLCQGMGMFYIKKNSKSSKIFKAPALGGAARMLIVF
jgi:hypothetical protein